MEEGRDTPSPQTQGTNEEIRKTTERKDMNPGEEIRGGEGRVISIF